MNEAESMRNLRRFRTIKGNCIECGSPKYMHFVRCEKCLKRARESKRKLRHERGENILYHPTKGNRYYKEDEGIEKN